MNQNIRIARELIALAKQMTVNTDMSGYHRDMMDFTVSDIEWNERYLQVVARKEGKSVEEIKESLPEEPFVVTIDMQDVDIDDDEKIRGRLYDAIFDTYNASPKSIRSFDYQPE